MRFQFTRPRGARQGFWGIAFACVRVSIHAPARGATRVYGLRPFLVGVSIHAPARGATRRPTQRKPRARVSIHAPARGATHVSMGRAPPGRCFNSRAREGRDVRSRCEVTPLEGFQFTRPRGARRAVAVAVRGVLTVSIHAPARGATQWFWGIAFACARVSIHAPARGATVGSVTSSLAGGNADVSANHLSRDGIPVVKERMD